MKTIRWEGICKKNRIQAISDITLLINRYGSILSFRKFSDLALSMIVEVEPGKIIPLHQELGRITDLEGTLPGDSEEPGQVTIFLNITFSKGTGDLEIEVPDIPE